MIVKVKIPEFTYRDEKTNKPVTIVREGNVPDNHPAVQAGLKAGYLVKVDSAPSAKSAKSAAKKEE